jgi:hypothetical protein
MPFTQARRSNEPLSNAIGEVTSIGVGVRQRLWDQMALECEAMAQLALRTGRTIPVGVVEQLDQALSTRGTPAVAATRRRDSSDDAPREETAVGTRSVADRSSLASLSIAHAALAQIILPATPEAVTHPFRYALGSLPIVRQMLVLAILSLFALLGIVLSGEINVANMGKTMLQLVGYPLFVKEAWLVSAASLGSCFQNLQRLNVVIADGTYDPKLQSTYWTRWVIGVISGIILSQLIYVFLLKAPTPEASVLPAQFGQPILALIGGYSGDLVHGILSHTIDTLASFFRVSGEPAAQNRARVTGGDAGEVDQGPRPGRPAA